MNPTAYTYQSGGQTFTATPNATATPEQLSAVSSNPLYTPVNGQSTTTLSSNKSGDILRAGSNLATLSNKGATTDPATGAYVLANGSAAVPPTTEPKQTATVTADTGTQDDSIMSNLNEMQRQADATFANTLENIKQKFTARKTQQDELTKSTSNSLQNSLLMGGVTGQGSSAQFAPISSQGIITANENYGIKKLAEIDALENDAIAEAKNAQLTGNFRILEAKNAQIEKIRAEKIAVATKLNEQIVKRNEETRLANMKSTRDSQVAQLYSQGITDTATILKKLNYDANGSKINNYTANDISETLKDIVPPGLDDLVKTLRTNGAPQDVISRVMSSGNLDEAYKNAGFYASGGSGIIGEYNYAKANGYTGTFSQYQNEDANRKIKVAAASSNPDRILTATEAQALQVPFGTVASQAYGKTIAKPPTETQLKDGLYATRAEDSIKTINALESKISKMNSAKWMSEKSLENTAIGNTLVSDEVKQVRQAERDFSTAVLRRESGAAISATEYETVEKQYFPRPGDDKTTLAQKAKNRQNVLDNFIRSSGGTYGAEKMVPDVVTAASTHNGIVLPAAPAQPQSGSSYQGINLPN